MAAMEENAYCANCAAPLAGRYCSQCGQKRIEDEDRRFSHLVAQFVQSLTDLDSRFWRSLRTLLFRPGRLSAEYLAGRRVPYMAPVSLFIIANLLYFVAPGITDFELPFIEHIDGDLRVILIEESRTLTPQQRERIADHGAQAHSPWTGSWVLARVAARNAETQARNPDASYTMRDYEVAYDQRRGEVSRLLIILHVPVLALLLMLFHVRSRRFFAEHFVVALHLFAFLIFLLELLVLPGALIARALGVAEIPGAVKIALPVLIIAYSARALQVVYARPMLLALPMAFAIWVLLFVFSVSIYRALQFAIIFAMT